MRSFWIVFLVLVTHFSFAQSVKKDIVNGNKAYHQKDYKAADEAYKTALSKDKKSFEAKFNQADVLYQQKKFEKATEFFQNLANEAPNDSYKSKAYHNLGNSLLQQKKYEESINAYKNSLKLNPKDNDTRYNLAYAQRQLQQQQQQQNQDKNDQNKDDKKDNKDQQNQDKKDNQDQGKNDQDKQNQDDQKQQDKNQGDKSDNDKKQEQQGQQPNEISKQDAERMLNSLNNDEKNVQMKLNKKKDENQQNRNIKKKW